MNRPPRAGKVQVLVASDVASRGLDIRGLPYVVNYDFPPRLEVYVHRRGLRLVSGLLCLFCGRGDVRGCCLGLELGVRACAFVFQCFSVRLCAEAGSLWVIALFTQFAPQRPGG
jgi:hypothetical protein